jgi:hypothetical protein
MVDLDILQAKHDKKFKNMAKRKKEPIAFIPPGPKERLREKFKGYSVIRHKCKKVGFMFGQVQS